MIKFIDSILKYFEHTFSRKATYQWFVIVIIGFIMNGDGIGVTSIVRELALDSKHYESLLHFFRSSAWKIDSIFKTWVNATKENAPVLKVANLSILIGDGVKQSKEAKRMPAVKKLHQESANSSKAEYIFGHLFGVVSVLIGNRQKQFALPLVASIQDGIKEIHKYSEPLGEAPSHVVQVITQAGNIAKELGASVVLLDRYFLSVPALKKALSFLDKNGGQLLEIVTKAKISCTAFKEAPAYCGKGRPRLKGEAVKLRSLFLTATNEFTCTELFLYGKLQKVEYYSIDLLWGVKLYKKLRFVLVKTKSFPPSIFVSTSLVLSPTDIIELYSYRYKIESSFKTLKHTIFAFTYRFWSDYVPVIDRFCKVRNTEALASITDEYAQNKILQTIKAIEGFVMCSCIACGILQMISLRFSDTLDLSNSRFLRTITNSIVSEDTVASYFRKNFFRLIYHASNIAFVQIIISKQNHLSDYPSKSA